MTTPTFDFALTTFSASEAEEVTGLSKLSQRDWRRHGFIPRMKGKAKFTIFDLARIIVIYELSRQNIALYEASKLAEIVFPTVAANVLFNRSSIAGLPEGFRSATIHRDICERFGYSPRAEKFLIVWANDAFVSFEDDIAAAFSGNPKTLFGFERGTGKIEAKAFGGGRNVHDRLNNLAADCSHEELSILLQTGRIIVLNLELFCGDRLVIPPEHVRFAFNRRPYVTAIPKRENK